MKTVPLETDFTTKVRYKYVGEMEPMPYPERLTWEWEKMTTKVVHHGDAGRGSIRCGAPEKSPKNWTWKPEEVTCGKCLRMIKARNQGRSKY